jgi:molybdopterin converting factor small subunit
LSIRVHLAGHLGNYTGRVVDIEIPGARDVFELLMRLCEMFPLIHDRILDEHDKTRPYVNVFVNEQNVRDLQSERTRVSDGDEVFILPSVAGGSSM